MSASSPQDVPERGQGECLACGPSQCPGCAQGRATTVLTPGSRSAGLPVTCSTKEVWNTCDVRPTNISIGKRADTVWDACVGSTAQSVASMPQMRNMRCSFGSAAHQPQKLKKLKKLKPVPLTKAETAVSQLGIQDISARACAQTLKHEIMT